MKRNIGTVDRVIRLCIALLLLAFAFWQKSWIAGFTSVFVFYEAFAGWCIYYQLIGKSSCPITEGNAGSLPQSPVSKFFLCFLLCFGVEFTAAYFTQESVKTWYPLLNKPWWTPPNIAFPIVWTIIYFLMAVSLWVITLSPSTEKKSAYTSFGIQLLLNFAWSFLFFYLKLPLWAFVDISLLLLAIGATITTFWKHSVFAGLLLFPYIAWVAFASTLNLYMLLLNEF